MQFGNQFSPVGTNFSNAQHPFLVNADSYLVPLLEGYCSANSMTPQEAGAIQNYYFNQNGRMDFLNKIMAYQQPPGRFPFRENNVTGEQLLELLKQYVVKLLGDLRAQLQNTMVMNAAQGSVFSGGNVGGGSIFSGGGNVMFSGNVGQQAGVLSGMSFGGTNTMFNSPQVQPAAVTQSGSMYSTGKNAPSKSLTDTPKAASTKITHYVEPVERKDVHRTMKIKSAIEASIRTYESDIGQRIQIANCNLIHGFSNHQSAIETALQMLVMTAPLYAVRLTYMQYHILPTPLSKIKSTLISLKKHIKIPPSETAKELPTETLLEHLKCIDKLEAALNDEPSAVANSIDKLIVDLFNAYTEAGHLSPIQSQEDIIQIDHFVEDIRTLLTQYQLGKIEVPAIKSPDFLIRLTSIIDRCVARFIHSWRVYSRDEISDIIWACGDQIYTDSCTARDYWHLLNANVTEEAKKHNTELLAELNKRLDAVTVIGVPKTVLYTNIIPPGALEFTDVGTLRSRVMKNVTNDLEFVINTTTLMNELPEVDCLPGVSSSHVFGPPTELILQCGNRQFEAIVGELIGDLAYISGR